jgi:hypothetical protein
MKRIGSTHFIKANPIEERHIELTKRVYVNGAMQYRWVWQPPQERKKHMKSIGNAGLQAEQTSLGYSKEWAKGSLII